MIKRMGLATVYGTAIFLGSALLFNVQPMAGRMLLPGFGGSAAVWTVCLVAFQVLLLGGYAYAALLNRFRLAVQIRCHIALLAAAALWPGFSLLKAPLVAETGSPVWRVLLAVAAGVGPAYLLLASGSALLQAWLARACPGRNVYRLYAVSNAGSLIGLFAYPFLVEPFLSIPTQQLLWRLLFAGYAILIAAVGADLASARHSPSCADISPHPRAPQATPLQHNPVWAQHPAWWWALPLLGAFLLVAATTGMTYDMTPLPMLWCLLLGSFLLSYIVGFSPLGETIFAGAGPVAIGVFVVYAVFRLTEIKTLWMTVLVGNGIVLGGGLFLHGWLYRIRPAPEKLTGYYLAIAAGGAAGGMLAGVAVPLLLNGVYELSGCLILLAILVFVRALRARRSPADAGLWVAAAGVLLLSIMLPQWGLLKIRDIVWRGRNFYAALEVEDHALGDPEKGFQGKIRVLTHGATAHGLQDNSLDIRHKPTSYYGPRGGGFPLLCANQAATNRPLRVGLVGLGIGTLAAYGREGDWYRFYEIDPQVAAVARDSGLFAYLSESKATVDIVMGDARLSLAREEAAQEAPWDVLIVDAFSGDSVPVHLLTREAVALFLSRTRADGIVALHISNRFLDLLPLLKTVARAEGVHFWAWSNWVGHNSLESNSLWVLMTRQPSAFTPQPGMVPIPESIIPPFPVLTDEKGSILSLVDWDEKRKRAYLLDARQKQPKRSH